MTVLDLELDLGLGLDRRDIWIVWMQYGRRWADIYYQ